LLGLSDEPASGGASGQITVFSWVTSLPQRGRAASASALACRRSGAMGRRRAAFRSTPPKRNCVAGWRRRHRARPSAAAQSTSLRPRNAGTHGRDGAWPWESTTRLAPGEPRCSHHRRRGRSVRREFFEIAIGQIGDHPGESFERCQPLDIAGPDVVNERVRVAMQIE
jgi:hypothetical protein